MKRARTKMLIAVGTSIAVAALLTGAGRGSNGTRSSAASCKVPRVLGLTLGKAKAKIKKAHCGVGKIIRARSNKNQVGRVLGQSPRPGVTRPQGFKVKLVVGRR